MRSIARACAVALPLLGLFTVPPADAGQRMNTRVQWVVTEADDDGSPLAYMEMESNPSLGQLTLLCGEKSGLQLRVDPRITPRPTSVTISNAKRDRVVLPFDEDGMVQASARDALFKLYERTTGMTGADEPKDRVPFSVISNRETSEATYDFRRFNQTIAKMNTACTAWRTHLAKNPQEQTAWESPPTPAPPHSPIATDMIRYCERWVYGRACDCVIDDLIQVTARSPLRIQNQSDKAFQLWKAYQEARFNGGLSITMSTQLPRYAQDIGVPAGQADQFVAETFTNIQAAAARCRKK